MKISILCSDVQHPVNERSWFIHTLVLHASDLPEQRCWSPHIWSIIQGEEIITVTLLEANDKLDTGDTWKKLRVHVPSTALYHEIKSIIYSTEIKLVDFAVDNYLTIQPNRQGSQKKQIYWPKRHPADSERDVHKSISEQFDLIRVCDPDRYPGFFIKDDKKYKLKIELFEEQRYEN